MHPACCLPWVSPGVAGGPDRDSLGPAASPEGGGGCYPSGCWLSKERPGKCQVLSWGFRHPCGVSEAQRALATFSRSHRSGDGPRPVRPSYSRKSGVSCCNPGLPGLSPGHVAAKHQNGPGGDSGNIASPSWFGPRVTVGLGSPSASPHFPQTNSVQHLR